MKHILLILALTVLAGCGKSQCPKEGFNADRTYYVLPECNGVMGDGKTRLADSFKPPTLKQMESVNSLMGEFSVEIKKNPKGFFENMPKCSENKPSKFGCRA